MLKKNLAMTLFTIGTMALSGCSSDSGAGGSADLSIQGILQLAGSQSLQKVASLKAGVSAQSTSLAELSVYCVTFAIPPVAGTGDVGSDGSFSVSLGGAADSAFGCFIMQGTTKVADMIFEDSDEKDMSGNASSTDKVNLATSANFGNIQLDLDAKKAVVDVAAIASNISSGNSSGSSSPFDFTGSYVIAKITDFTLPSGYEAVCASGSNNCDGPQDQMPIYLRRTTGKDFTPSSTCLTAVSNKTFDPDTSTCTGTTGTTDRHVIEIWASQTAFQSCAGSSSPKMGVRFAEAKAFGNIDLSNSGRTDAKFTWTADWKDTTNATASWDVYDCGNGNVPGGYSNAWTCFDDTAPAEYQANVFLGCQVAGTSTPYQLSNSEQSSFWSGGTNNSACPSGMSSAPTGYSCSEHTNMVGSTNVSCYNINGVFTMAGSAPSSADSPSSNSGSYGQTKLLDGTVPNKCADLDTAITNASGNAAKVNRLKIAQLRCYADYYYNNVSENDRRNENACYRRVELNWEATDPADFMREGGVKQAENQFVIELLKYTDNDTATFRQEEERREGVEVNSQWQPCSMVEKFTMTLKKVSDTKILADMQSDIILTDSNEVCQKAASDGILRVGQSKTMFYMNKQ